MKKVKRLYKEFRPERYELYLEPDREAATFSGRVVIVGRKVGKPSRRITLHQKGLSIQRTVVTAKGKQGSKKPVELERVNTHKSYDELRLHARDMLYPGEYRVEIEFSGKITEQMHGIYPCNFKLDGKNRQLIATQFESHHAREAFPCIDEPEAKTTFDLTLSTPADETVIAGTPVKSQKKSGKKIITTFETTPRMSTYLLAFVYGELGYTESSTKDGVTVRVYATPENVRLTQFALDVGVRTLEFFEDYFSVKYPLPKLDMIGLPDFSAGAMENWGLITFREQMFYVDPEHSSIDTKQIAAMVIAHEVSHQWFGNLVTMKWWDDLWLNESFANIMEYRAVDELFPEWRIWEEFVSREIGSALSRDSLPNVQPVRTAVNHPDELSSVFDPAIVYAKGGSLLNMVRMMLGEDSFREGLKNYFEKHQYSNTVDKDLWEELGRAAGMDVSSMMKTWLHKPGFPVLTVEHKPGSSETSVSQRRLTVGKDNGPPTTWAVPLASSRQLDKPVLTKPADSFKLDGSAKYPLVFNHEGQSYFVSRYQNPEHLDTILNGVKDGALTPIDRLLLVQSYLLLEKAGEVLTIDNLKLLDAYAGEREESVWSILASIIGNARTLTGKDEILETKLNAFVAPLVKPLIKELGWDGKKDDSSQTLKLRALAISLGAVCQIPEVIEEGLKRFRKFTKPSGLASDIRGPVYFIAVRHGKAADFDKLLGLYKELTNAEEKWEIASELTATRESKRIKQLLGMITEEIRLQDVSTWFAWLIRNKYGTEQAWQWLSDNWRWIEDKYGNDKSYDYFPRYAASAFSYPEQLDAYRKFFSNMKILALERPIRLGIEEIEGRVAWRAKNEAAVRTWLNERF